jgi:hypothetical protein
MTDLPLEGNVTRKFQEAAEYRKQWEPFEELGITRIDPEEMAELLAFRELARPGAVQGVVPAGWRAVDGAWRRQTSSRRRGGGMDMGAGADMIGQAAGPAPGPDRADLPAAAGGTEPRSGRVSTSPRSSTRLQGAARRVRPDAVCQLALAYDGPEAVEKGFADYQRLIGQAEKGVLSGKLQQPPPPEQGGRPGTQAKSITDFGEASQAARRCCGGP